MEYSVATGVSYKCRSVTVKFTNSKNYKPNFLKEIGSVIKINPAKYQIKLDTLFCKYLCYQFYRASYPHLIRVHEQ